MASALALSAKAVGATRGSPGQTWFGLHHNLLYVIPLIFANGDTECQLVALGLRMTTDSKSAKKASSAA